MSLSEVGTSTVTLPQLEGSMSPTAYSQFLKNVAPQLHICNHSFFLQSATSSSRFFKEMLLYNRIFALPQSIAKVRGKSYRTAIADLQNSTSALPQLSAGSSLQLHIRNFFLSALPQSIRTSATSLTCRSGTKIADAPPLVVVKGERDPTRSKAKNCKRFYKERQMSSSYKATKKA
jgi:hypothetical protein